MSSLTLEQLRIFVIVARREHFTRAAEILGLTQSGVSAAISALESQFVTPLFDRVGRGVRLTDTGRSFLNEAEAILARVEAAKATVDELNGLQRGTVRICASQTIASYWLPRQLTSFIGLYPGIKLLVRVGNTEAVGKAILDPVMLPGETRP